MKGIKMSDCRFYVDEDARTIVCVIPDVIYLPNGDWFRTKDMLSDYVRENFEFSDIEINWVLSSRLEDELTMPRSFIGKAVCSDEDEWDVETGKLIAFSRAKDKCYRSFFKRANKLVQALDRRLGDMIESFNTFGQKLDEKQKMMDNKIKELTNVEDE